MPLEDFIINMFCRVEVQFARITQRVQLRQREGRRAWAIPK